MAKITDSILDAIEIMLNEKIKSLTLTKVFPSTIYAINTDGTYTIAKDKNKYNVKNGLCTTLALGQNIWVMIPNGNIKDMFVCGVR